MPPVTTLTPAQQAALQDAITQLTQDNANLTTGIATLSATETDLQLEDDTLKQIQEAVGLLESFPLSYGGPFPHPTTGLAPAWEFERKHQTGTYASGLPVTETNLQDSATGYTTPLFNPSPGPNPTEPWELIAAPLPIPPIPTSSNKNLFGGDAVFAANERDSIEGIPATSEEDQIAVLKTVFPVALRNGHPAHTAIIAAVAAELAALTEQIASLDDIIARGEIVDLDPVTSSQLITLSDISDASTAKTNAQAFETATLAWQVNILAGVPDLTDVTLDARVNNDLIPRRTFIDGTRKGQIEVALNRIWSARYYWIRERFNQRTGTWLNLNGNQNAQTKMQDLIDDNNNTISAMQDILNNQ